MLTVDNPQRFRIWQLEILISLYRLHENHKNNIDVESLACKTREGLHKLSQPLSAIQGRLQLLAAKAGPDDPNLEIYSDLVGMAMEASRHLMDIQQTQNDFS